MNMLIRLLKWMFRVVGYAVASILVLVILAVCFIGFTVAGSRFAAEQISALISTPDQTVTISDASGLLTGKLRLGAVVVSDTKGTFAELHDIAVDWSPLALINRRFEARQVSAQTLTVSRKPVTTQPAEKTTSNGFSLPVEIKVDKLSLPNINLGPALAGRAFSLVAEGAVQASSDTIALDLATNRKDTPDARATANLLFAPAENRLTLKASVAEPEGGLLANLLLLPGRPAVALTLDGEGPLSNWAGELQGAVDGKKVVTIDGKHTLSAEGRHRVALTGGGTIDALLPPMLRPLFSGETRLNVATTFNNTGSVNIESGSITTGSMLVSASGAIDPSGSNSLKANVKGIKGPVQFIWPLDGGDARLMITSVDLALSGAAKSARLDTAIALESVFLPQGRFGQVQLTAKGEKLDLNTRIGTIQTRLSVGRSTFVNPDLDRLVKAPLTLAAPLRLTPNALGLDATTLESASLGGTVTGAYDFNVRSATGNFRLFAAPSVLPAPYDAKFDGTISAEGYLSAVIGGRMSLENLVVKSGTIEANGNVLLENNNLKASLAGRLPDLTRLADDIEGAAGFNLTADGPLAALDIKAKINSAEASLAGRSLQSLAIAVTGKADPKSPQGNIKASGTIDGQAINVDADLISKDGKTSAPALRAQVGPNTLTGALQFSPTFLPAGTLTFDFPDLSLLAALAAQEAAGDLTGTIVLSNASNVPGVTVKAAGAMLSRGDFSVSKPVIDISAPDLKALSATGTISAEKLGSESAFLTGLSLGFSRAGTITSFDLKSQYDGAPLTTKGGVDNGNGGISIALQSFAAAPKGIAIALADPTTIAVTNGAARINGLTLRTGEGRVTVNGTAGETLDIAAAIANLPASLVNSFAPTLGAAGTISGTVTAKGTAAAPTVGYDLAWAGAEVSQTRSAGLAPFGVKANGNFANNTVTLETSVSGQNGLALSGGGSIGVSGSKALSLAFTGRLPFSVLAGQLAAQGFALNGTAALDVKVAGTTEAPTFSGNITANGATFVDARRNLAVNGLTAAIALNQTTATISRLTGTLSTGGTVSAAGTVGLTDGLPANVTVTLKDATYVDGTLFTTTANGALTLTGPLLTAPVLGGKLTLKEAAITVPEKLPASLTELNIRHKNAPADVRAQMRDLKQGEGSANGSSSTLGLDLQIDAPTGIFVRGRGIDAELGGNLTIHGTASAPAVSGAFTMRRGRIVILTKRLDFTSGTITFGGGLIPVLNMVATTASSSTTITVTVTGLANDPNIGFSSAPALPQDEVLAQLIFGQSMAKLSPLQIAQLAEAVSQLAGGRSSSLFETLRGNLGVDDLDVSTDEKGQAKVTAGKYLNSRTYFELEQGGTEGSKAIINLDVGKGFKLRGEAGTSGGAGGVFYEKEY